MNHSARFARNAFTLIELLVVIAIIAVLAGLLIPVMGRMIDTAKSSKCVANLKQIAVAINSYCQENEQRLPGPLSEGQFAKWTEGDPRYKGSLAKILEKYLGTTEDKPSGQGTQGSQDRDTVMRCPAWASASKGLPNAPVYIMNFEDRLEEYDNRVPWGELDASIERSEPIKKTMLGSWHITASAKKKKPDSNVELMNLTETWAMKDADQEDFANSEWKPSMLSDLVPKPVHNDHRNVLYYDMHVGKMRLDDTILQ
jgi:prepilin-type N-terminal cleavage/methylation domain-containing protein